MRVRSSRLAPGLLAQSMSCALMPTLQSTHLRLSWTGSAAGNAVALGRACGHSARCAAAARARTLPVPQARPDPDQNSRAEAQRVGVQRQIPHPRPSTGRTCHRRPGWPCCLAAPGAPTAPGPDPKVLKSTPSPLTRAQLLQAARWAMLPHSSCLCREHHQVLNPGTERKIPKCAHATHLSQAARLAMLPRSSCAHSSRPHSATSCRALASRLKNSAAACALATSWADAASECSSCTRGLELSVWDETLPTLAAPSWSGYFSCNRVLELNGGMLSRVRESAAACASATGWAAAASKHRSCAQGPDFSVQRLAGRLHRGPWADGLGSSRAGVLLDSNPCCVRSCRQLGQCLRGLHLHMEAGIQNSGFRAVRPPAGTVLCASGLKAAGPLSSCSPSASACAQLCRCALQKGQPVRSRGECTHQPRVWRTPSARAWTCWSAPVRAPKGAGAEGSGFRLSDPAENRPTSSADVGAC